MEKRKTGAIGTENVFSLTQATEAELIIVECGTILCWQLGTQNRWTMGRKVPSNSPDIPLHASIVGRSHGEFLCLQGKWFYYYSGSKNSTFYNGDELPSQTGGHAIPIPLSNGDVLRVDYKDLNTPDKNGVLLLFSTDGVSNNWRYYSLEESCPLFIGRDPRQCQLVVPLPYISAKHACISQYEGRFYITDCKSRAGTWLNAKAVTDAMPLREKDKFSLCDCHFVFTGNGIVYFERAAQRSVAHKAKEPVIQARILSKSVPTQGGKKELLRNVQLSIPQGSLVALLGGSGAGKTTLMNCLNGVDQWGVEGEVLFSGENLYQNFERLKFLIGSVPQQNKLHTMLSVEEELREAAIFRLPADTSGSEIRQRVDDTIRVLNLTGVRRSRIQKLSGGEQKRVNIGIELVADRSLLCLDEPDAGLDPNAKRELFSILKKLAVEQGKCILTIIHDVAEITLFDQLIMLAKVNNVGRLAFAGAPEDARSYFGVTDLKDAYSKIAEKPEHYIKD